MANDGGMIDVSGKDITARTAQWDVFCSGATPSRL